MALTPGQQRDREDALRQHKRYLAYELQGIAADRAQELEERARGFGGSGGLFKEERNYFRELTQKKLELRNAKRDYQIAYISRYMGYFNVKTMEEAVVGLYPEAHMAEEAEAAAKAASK
jgi:hypothetical protein